MDMVSNTTHVGCGVLNDASIGTKGPKVCQENIPTHHYTTTSLNRWDKPGWIHAFMFFMPNSDPTIWMSPQKSRLIQDLATFFQSSIVQFWWACVNCILRFLFLADRSGTWCDLLLLKPICFRVRRVVRSDDGILPYLGCNECLFEYCAFLSSLSSLPILLWPFTSRYFRPHNCRSLDIFSFSDHSL